MRKLALVIVTAAALMLPIAPAVAGSDDYPTPPAYTLAGVDGRMAAGWTVIHDGHDSLFPSIGVMRHMCAAQTDTVAREDTCRADWFRFYRGLARYRDANGGDTEPEV